MRRLLLISLLSAALACLGLVVGAGSALAVDKGHVRALQRQAVSKCSPTSSDRLHKDRHGRLTLSRALSDCAPITVRRSLYRGGRPSKFASVLLGQTGPDLSNNDPVYQGQYAIRRAAHTFE